MRAKLFYLLGGAIFSAWAGTIYPQAVVEGRVQLPKPAAERALTQRYQPAADIDTAPIDPPMAVVYLEGNFASAARPKAVAHMVQKNINFVPNLMAIQVGTTVDFPNLDETYHNVFSYSKAKRFDLGRYRKDETPATVLFDKPGVVSLHCEIHERMRGTIVVLDTPHFVRTDTEGRFRLERLPAGRYVLKAWLGENDVREQPVELKANTTLRVDFPAR